MKCILHSIVIERNHIKVFTNLGAFYVLKEYKRKMIEEIIEEFNNKKRKIYFE